MSEYQYYEFRAIDRPLRPEEQQELRKLSTRAEITATSFTNEYNYGDFKGSPETLMTRYFDAFVYVANWGTHRLMFRMPRSVFDVDAVAAYFDDEYLMLEVKGEHAVLEFTSENEDEDGWVEGEVWMPALIPIRAELIRGDFRALYLGWLGTIGFLDPEDDDVAKQLEPPVPPGLAKLSPSLRELAEFLRVEDELIEVAATLSEGEPPEEPSRDDLACWVKTLPIAAKEAYLVRFLAEEGDLTLRAELARQFREATAPKTPRTAAPEARRTVAELLGAYETLIAEKDRKAAECAEAERVRRDREQAKARAAHLDALARRESSAWGEVEEWIATKRPGDYDLAVDRLVDLLELATRAGRAPEAQARISELRYLHAKKSTLIARFNKRNLSQ